MQLFTADQIDAFNEAVEVHGEHGALMMVEVISGSQTFAEDLYRAWKNIDTKAQAEIQVTERETK